PRHQGNDAGEDEGHEHRHHPHHHLRQLAVDGILDVHVLLAHRPCPMRGEIPRRPRPPGTIAGGEVCCCDQPPAVSVALPGVRITSHSVSRFAPALAAMAAPVRSPAAGVAAESSNAPTPLPALTSKTSFSPTANTAPETFGAVPLPRMRSVPVAPGGISVMAQPRVWPVATRRPLGMVAT